MHKPLIALTEHAVEFARNPEVELPPVEADPEDEIGVLAGTLAEMEASLRRLRQSERMAAVGVLAATVAHEIGNKLNPMGFVVHNLRKRQEKGKPIDPKQLELLKKSIESCTLILDKLRSTARPAPKGDVSLNDVLDDVAMFLGAQISSRGIAFSLEPGEDVPTVFGQRTELVQVVLNLVINARDAMDDATGEKRITVATWRDEETGGAGLSVKDNGVGMTDEVKARIYEPGFTTKGLVTGDGAGGSGLGLHVSYGILSRHGVEPRVISAPGEGTEFRMVFPA